MIATFPMITKTNARLLPGYGKYLGELKKGTEIFAYVKGIESKRDEEVIRKSGSARELAMLCGKPIENENVQEYLKNLGSGYEKSRIELPERLEFSDTREEVEKKPGKPNEIKKYYNTLGMHYPAFGSQVTYNPFAPDDMKAKIHHIVGGNPEIMP